MMSMQPPSIVKPILILAGTAVVLTVMHFAASFLIPVLLAIFFAALLAPIYSWLKKRRIPKFLARVLRQCAFEALHEARVPVESSTSKFFLSEN